MNQFDERLDALLPYVKALASDMAEDRDSNAHRDAAHVYAAIISLRRAYSSRRKADEASMDLERAERLRAGL